MDDKWIDSIKDKMTDYELAPPDGLLEAVEAKARAKRIGRLRLAMAIAASVAIIVGVAVAIALIPDVPDIAPRPLMSESTVVKDTAEVFRNQFVENAAVKGGSPLMPNAMNASTSSAAAPVADAPHVSVNEQLEPAAKEDRHTEGNLSQPSENISQTRNAECLPDTRTAESDAVSQSSYSVGVAASANGIGGLFGGTDISGRMPQASPAGRNTRMGGMLVDARPAPTFVERFDHRLPVRVSVDFSWPLGHGFDINAGLCYSYLYASIRYGYSDSPLFKASQSLHFIGIPVNVRYTPWNFRKLDVYASAGVMAEKCVAGSIRTENPANPEYRYAGCDDRPFQFSVNAAVGLQYSLARSCAVFIQPGLGLYLKNGSPLRTIYSERPLSFTINVGLRFRHP